MDLDENIPEIKELQQLEISKEHIREIMKKRSGFDLKIQSKNLQHYIDYIIHEEHVLALAVNNMRKVKFRNPTASVTLKFLLKRINKLFQEASDSFPNDYNIWERYVAHCKRVKDVEHAGVVIHRMLELHSDKEQAWILAITFFNETQKDRSKIRNLFIDGLNVHKAGKLLYKRALEYELKLVERETYTAEPAMTDNVKQCYEQIYKYLSMILENLKGNCQYYFDILKVLDDFHFTSSITDKFIDQILEVYGKEACVWDNLAQRELLGLHYKPTFEETSAEIQKNLCIAKYEEGLTKVETDQKKELWSKFLKYLTKGTTYYENIFVQDVSETFYLDGKFEQASAEGQLSEEGYFWWLEMNELNQKIEYYGVDGSNFPVIERYKEMDRLKDMREREILEKGIAAIPQSVAFWNSYMFNRIKKMERDPEIQNIFERGVAALGKNSKSLWMSFLKYKVCIVDDDDVEFWYKKGCESSEEVATFLKPYYLEWSYVVYGTEKAREVYKEIANRKPFLMELHKTMLKYEYIAKEPDFESWEYVHKLAIEQFPEPDMWINYIRFLINDKRCDNSYIEEVVNNAVQSLPDVQRDIFQYKYTKLITAADFE